MTLLLYIAQRFRSLHPPTISPYCIQYLQIQSPFAEGPLSPMSIRALEVGTAGLVLYVPTTATLIGKDRQVEVAGHILDEDRVLIDGV